MRVWWAVTNPLVSGGRCYWIRRSRGGEMFSVAVEGTTPLQSLVLPAACRSRERLALKPSSNGVNSTCRHTRAGAG